jgi:dolichol kinase
LEACAVSIFRVVKAEFPIHQTCNLFSRLYNPLETRRRMRRRSKHIIIIILVIVLQNLPST